MRSTASCCKLCDSNMPAACRCSQSKRFSFFLHCSLPLPSSPLLSLCLRLCASIRATCGARRFAPRERRTKNRKSASQLVRKRDFCGPVSMRSAPPSSFKPQEKQNGEDDAQHTNQRGTLLREAGSEQGKDVLVLLAAAHAHGPRREDLSCRPPTVARAAAALRGGLSQRFHFRELCKMCALRVHARPPPERTLCRAQAHHTPPQLLSTHDEGRQHRRTRHPFLNLVFLFAEATPSPTPMEREAMLTPSLFHGGAQRIENAHSILMQFEREQDDLSRRRQLAHEELIALLRDELEDGAASLQRRHAQVVEYARRCSAAIQASRAAAHDRLQVCLADIDAMRAELDRKEEVLRAVLSECLEARVTLLEEQMHVFSSTAPETAGLVRRIQDFLDTADTRTLLRESKGVVGEIQHMSNKMCRLPSPADLAPFEHIFLSNIPDCRQALSAVEVVEHPVLFFAAPCSGSVNGGTTMRLEGSGLTGQHVKVFVGGVLCDHVAAVSGGGGSSLTCVTPPCQNELQAEIVIEVDGCSVKGGCFHYVTPAPRVQAQDVLLYCNDAGLLQVPIRGEGFAHVPSLNQLELRLQDVDGNDCGVLLPYHVAEATETALLCLVQPSQVPPAHVISATVSIAGVSSGHPTRVGRVPEQPKPIVSSTSPNRREFTGFSDYTLQSQYPPSPQAAKYGAGLDEPSRVIRARHDFMPGAGKQHAAFQIDCAALEWGFIGVACEGGQSGGTSYGASIRGWTYGSNGRCSNSISGERVETGVTWGAGSRVGVSACFESGTITFFHEDTVAHIFGSLSRERCRAFVEVAGAAGAEASAQEADCHMDTRASSSPSLMARSLATTPSHSGMRVQRLPADPADGGHKRVML